MKKHQRKLAIRINKPEETRQYEQTHQNPLNYMNKTHKITLN